MKFQKKNCSHLLIFLVLWQFIFSCTSVKYQHHEESRLNHAKEILADNYDGSIVEYFENDPRLVNYLNDYFDKKIPKLSTENVINKLLEESNKNQYDPVFLMAVIKTESQFRPEIIGQAGEIGLMQIKPETAKWICKKAGLKWEGNEALKDPHYNIQVGSLYFAYLKKSHQSKASLYIAAYNSGPAQLSRLPASYKKNHPYLNKVISNYLGIYKDLKDIKLKSQKL